MHTGGWTARTVVLLVLGVLSAPARAADVNTAEAKAHFKKGSDLYRQGHYPECGAEFEASYAARPHGVTLFNAAQCYERAEEFLKAADYYREYLKVTPNAPDRGAVDALIRSLDMRASATAQKKMQTLVVLSTPSSAKVSIDGAFHGNTPLTEQLVAGEHRVDVSLEQYRSQSRKVTLAPEKPLTLDLKLEAIPLAVAPPATPDEAVATSVSAKQPAPRGRQRVWTWVALGTAGAAEIVGGLLGASAAAQQKTLNTDFAGSRNVADARVKSLKGTAGAANAFYITGGILFAGSVTLFFLEGR